MLGQFAAEGAVPVRHAVTAVVVAVALLGAAGCTAERADGARPRATAGTSAAATSVSTAPTTPQARIKVDPPLGTQDFAPGRPLVVTAEQGTLTEVAVTDPAGESVTGSLSADRRSWQSAVPLGYDDSYTVTARAANADGVPTDVTGSIGTVTPVTLTYASAIPNPDLTSVGVGQPIAVYFDEDIADRAAVERQLVVTSTPPVAGAWSWLSDREVHYRPQEYWPAGTHVVLDVLIYGQDVGGGIYGQENRHIEFDVDDAMVATVDNSTLQVQAYRNGELVKTMPTAMGKPGNETPSGTYVVMDQHSEYTMDSSTYGVPIGGPDGYRTEVEFASRLSNSGIFLHGAPWSLADQGVRNVSHGCLNVSDGDAQWFYENFGRGDIVQVTGTGVPLESTDGFGDWNVSWADWLAGSALH